MIRSGEHALWDAQLHRGAKVAEFRMMVDALVPAMQVMAKASKQLANQIRAASISFKPLIEAQARAQQQLAEQQSRATTPGG